MIEWKRPVTILFWSSVIMSSITGVAIVVLHCFGENALITMLLAVVWLLLMIWIWELTQVIQ